MQLRIFTEPQQGASYDQLLAVARLAEELGFDAFFRSDHYLRMGEGSGLPGPSDAWITLAGLARDTQRIRLGTLVTPITFRHPGPLAISVANVDAMSGGRVELGIGAGWFDDEHHAYAHPVPAAGRALRAARGAAAIITGLWSTPEGEMFSYDGKHHSVLASPALPKPVQSPLPIIIGGMGPKRTPRLAARYASEFNHTFAPPDAIAAGTERVRQACEASRPRPGHDDVLDRAVACVGADDAEVERRAEEIGQPVEHLRANSVAGTLDQARERLAFYADQGLERVYLQVLDLDDLDHVRLLAELLPSQRWRRSRGTRRRG